MKPPDSDRWLPDSGRWVHVSVGTSGEVEMTIAVGRAVLAGADVPGLLLRDLHALHAEFEELGPPVVGFAGQHRSQIDGSGVAAFCREDCRMLIYECGL